MSRPVITLTTDFGQGDGYVGAMKGVILSICPQAVLVDISHEIRPQAVRQAAFVLHSAASYFPPDSVHLVVVDPGVGSARRPVAVRTEQATYVAPDNGVLSMVLDQNPARLAIGLRLTGSRFHLPAVSATFHGRDIFAPAAAHLACGRDPRQLGEPLPLSELVTLPTLRPQPQSDGTWLGEVLHVDRFGNLVTNFLLSTPPPPISVQIAGERIATLSRTYADVERGVLVAYVGSSGHLEVAVREGNAALQLGLNVGAPVKVEGLP